MSIHSTSIGALADELASAVEVIMSPQTLPQARQEAYMACERFKEESSLCANVGLCLASNSKYGPNVKHFGLQMMEHTIKFKWNSITQPEKLFIKENAMKLLSLGVGPAEDKSLSHLKDALTRIIVEMIKREWPQQWPTLMSELSDTCTKGESQTELVLLVFLRLVEDVAILKTIESNQRRKDLYQALTNNMSDIFEFFLRLIEMHFTTFREANVQGRSLQAQANARVVEVVLLTLTGFVEWVSIHHITCNNSKLLQMLCILLNDHAFQCNAVECLTQITCRKGPWKERKPIMMLFDAEPIRYIFSSSQMLPFDSSVTALEQNHNFLKKLVQMLCGMVQQLFLTYSKDSLSSPSNLIQERPALLDIFMECVLSLTQHPSLNVAHGTWLIWTLLWKLYGPTKDPVVLSYIPKVIEVVAPRIIKIPYPNERSLTMSGESGNGRANTTTYICLEYDCEEDFQMFFYRCRTDFLEIFRQATNLQPLVTFAYCEQWLRLRLAKARNEHGNTECSILDPVYLEWEALVYVIDGVLGRILMVSERPSTQTGLHLLEECLKLDNANPLILSILLSCISALFVFLSMSSCQITANNCVAMSGVSLLPRVLEKIFAALLFTDPQGSESNLSPHATFTSRTQACKNLRRHAASLIVKLGQKYPLLLLPVFDQINTHIRSLLQQPQSPIGKLERISLQEALLLISNHFYDYERQSNFVGEIMRDSVSTWEHFSQVVFKTPIDFIHYVGLDKPAIFPLNINTDICHQQRNSLINALYIVLSVIKRCTWPDDPDRALRGGFIMGFTELGNPICRNPASPYIIPLLPHILSLLRVLNELFQTEALSALSEGYRNVHSIQEQEKKILIGGGILPMDPLDPIVKKPPTPLDKMQQFMALLYEGCYHMMGSMGPSLGRDFYQLDGIATALINSTFSQLDKVSDYRLRPIIRVFLKPFVNACPPAFYDTLLLPIFSHLTPILYSRLTTRWAYITSLYESGQLNNEDQTNNTDTAEVIEDMLNRSLTREYLNVLKIALIGDQIDQIDCPVYHQNAIQQFHSHHNSIGNQGTIATNDVAMEPDEHSMDGVTTSRAGQSSLLSDIISDLGGKLIRNSLTSNYILMTILSALYWNDGSCNLKAVKMVAPVLRLLHAEKLMDANKAVNAFTAVLRGLQVHGQHDTNQSSLITLGVQTYELLRLDFPCLREILLSLPNVNVADVNKFDEKTTVALLKGNKVDKTKKDIFKKLTSPLIGCSINQLFRHEIKIVNLPPVVSNKMKNSTMSSNDILSNSVCDLSNLFQTGNNH